MRISDWSSDVCSSDLEMRALAELKPHPRNARTHDKKQVALIADSIGTFGFTNPILIDGAGTIIAGHARVEAAKLRGMSHVPVRVIDHLTPAQLRAYVIADNRTADRGIGRASGRDRGGQEVEIPVGGG